MKSMENCAHKQPRDLSRFQLIIAVLVSVLPLRIELSRVLAGEKGDMAALEMATVARVQDYLRIDTVNPPGNESRAVEFLGQILAAEGIPYETAESAPGRGNLWARLPGGSKPGIVLLHHSDVVPADADAWSVPPLSGIRQDGYIYGRGALDMKSTGIVHLQAFLALHRMNKPLNRDVIFMATADEEAGGSFGAGWLIKHKPEIFDDVGLLLTEGGGGVIVGGKPLITVQVTEKIPVWVRLVATGKPGHGSTPRTESAVTRLLDALARVRSHQFPPMITPQANDLFKALAQNFEGELRRAFENMPDAAQNPDFLRNLHELNPDLHALTRHTCSITRLVGSDKINVVPAKATAALDFRIVPHQDVDEFLEDLREIVADESIAIEKLATFSPEVSTTDSELYRAIEKVCHQHFPEAPVVASMSTGFTDSHFLRPRGIACYGFVPMVIPIEEAAGVHGNDERISVENLKTATRLTLEILEQVVY